MAGGVSPKIQAVGAETAVKTAADKAVLSLTGAVNPALPLTNNRDREAPAWVGGGHPQLTITIMGPAHTGAPTMLSHIATILVLTLLGATSQQVLPPAADHPLPLPATSSPGPAAGHVGGPPAGGGRGTGNVQDQPLHRLLTRHIGPLAPANDAPRLARTLHLLDLVLQSPLSYGPNGMEAPELAAYATAASNLSSTCASLMHALDMHASGGGGGGDDTSLVHAVSEVAAALAVLPPRLCYPLARRLLVAAVARVWLTSQGRLGAGVLQALGGLVGQVRAPGTGGGWGWVVGREEVETMLASGPVITAV